MKKILLMVFGLGFALSVSAQSLYENKDAVKALKKETKAVNDAVERKAPKIARKTAKEFKKAGWLITPGSLPLEKQFERSYGMRYEMDNEYYPKYMMAEAMSIGQTFDAAKMQALELSKQNLAGQIQTEVTALIENTVANEQLSKEEAASIAETVMASKNLISQSIGRVVPVVEAYRPLKNGNKEVYVSIAYNNKAAWEGAKKAIVKELEKKGDNLHEKLGKLMDME